MWRPSKKAMYSSWRSRNATAAQAAPALAFFAAHDAAEHPADDFAAHGAADGAHRRAGHALRQAFMAAPARSGRPEQRVGQAAQEATASGRGGGAGRQIGRAHV